MKPMSVTTPNYLNIRLVGILRTKPGTPSINAIQAIQSAFDAGADAVEITANSDHWQEVVDECTKRNLNIGVGSIKNSSTAHEAISHGANFLVSPGVFPGAIAMARTNHIPILPGVFTIDEAKRARMLGPVDQKFFPASVCTHEDLFKAIKEPFRDEFEELIKKGWKIMPYGSEQFQTLKLNKYIEINTPTAFYDIYLNIKDSKNPHNPIVIKLPVDEDVGFKRLRTLSAISNEWQVRTYAVGGISDKNMKEALDNGAYGVCPGSGMFNADAIFNGDYERVQSDVKKHVDIIKELIADKL